jgi:hypothetical protein
MPQSALCQQVAALVERHVANKKNLVWTVFDADVPDVGLAPPNDRTVFIRFYPGHRYVYDLIVSPPLQESLEQDIQRFIEQNIPG